MLSQTKPKTDNIVVIDSTKDELEETNFTGQLSPKSPNEVFKDGQTLEVIQETSKIFRDENSTVDSYISDSMKLLTKPKESENGQGDLLSSLPTTEDTVAMTANNDFVPSDDDVDILTHQTGISDKCSLNIYMNISNFQEELCYSCKSSLVNYALEKSHKSI